MGKRNLRFDVRKTTKGRSSVTITLDLIHPCACQQVVPSCLSQMYIAYTVHISYHRDGLKLVLQLKSSTNEDGLALYKLQLH